MPLFTNLTALALAATAAQPFPKDGFTYPGDAGTEPWADAYYKRWEEHLAKLPPGEPGMPSALREFQWLEGRWNVVVRDYEADPKKGRGMIEAARGTASIAFTPDKHWLRIDASTDKWSSARYIGYDRAARQLVLREVGSPGQLYREPLAAREWTANRVRFGPAESSYYGLRLTDRITLIRTDTNSFRIVVEGRLGNGTFMAVDDMIFTRSDR